MKKHFVLIVACWCILVSSVWAQNFKIGMPAPMTGPVAEVGRYMKNASLIAMDDINSQGGILGKKLELVFGDDESKPEVGVSAYEKLISKDQVDMVIGGFHSSVSIAQQVVAAKYDKIFYSTGSTSDLLEETYKKDPQKYWMFFKLCASFKTVKPTYRSFYKMMERKGALKPTEKTIFIIIEDTDSSRQLAGHFTDAMAEDGWKRVALEPVNLAQADYSAQMSKLRTLKADILFSSLTSPAACASLTKNFAESGIRSFYHTNYTPIQPEYVKLAGKASETVVWNSPTCWIPKYAKPFLDKYRKRFNEEPGMNAGLQYDGMMNVFEAIKLAKSTDQRKIADALLKVNIPGNCGVYKIDPATHTSLAGDDYMPVMYYQIINGKHIILYPEQYKDGEYVTQKWLQ